MKSLIHKFVSNEELSNKNRNALLSIVPSVVAVSLTLAVAACGGGGGGGASATTGTAAVGAAMPKAELTFLDEDGNTSTATTGSDGKYQVPTSVGEFYIVKAVGSVGDKTFTLYSIGPLADTKREVNINPLTDVMTRQGFKGTTALEAMFTNKTKLTEDNAKEMPNAVASLAYQMGELVETVGLMTQDQFEEANPFTAEMKADKSDKLDVLLDSFLVRCSVADCSTRGYDVTPKFPVPSGANALVMKGDTTTGKTGTQAPDVPNYSKLDKSSFESFKTALAKLDAAAGANSLLLGCAPPKDKDGVTISSSGGDTVVVASFDCKVAKSDGKSAWYTYTVSTSAWTATTTPPADNNTAPTIDSFCGKDSAQAACRQNS